MAKSTAPTLTPISAATPVIAAQKRLTDVAGHYDAACTRLSRYAAALSITRADSVDVLDRLEAQRYHVEAQMDVLSLERELLEAQQADVNARDAARRDLAERFYPELRSAVGGLKTALLAARAANTRLASVQVSLHEMTGTPFDSLAWMELGYRLDVWLDAVKAAGLDD